MYAMEESWDKFQEDPRLIDIFATACLSICSKFGQCVQRWQMRSLRRNVSVEHFLAMEVAILEAFDWCFEHIESPTLSGMLHLSGVTASMDASQIEKLNESILKVYASSNLIEQRMQEPGVWAMACLCHSGTCSAVDMEKANKYMLEPSSESVKAAVEMLKKI